MKHLKLFEEYKTKIGLICTTFGLYNIDILIPKKNHEGYLKSVFGGHNVNEPCKKFMDLSPNYVREINDLDGYLSLNIERNFWFGNEEKYTNEIKNILLKVFPYVTDFKKVGRDEFYEIITNR